MPNHITNLVTITGPDADVAAFLARHVVEREHRGEKFLEFAFETVIPVPQCVKETERDNEHVGDGQVETYARALISNRRLFMMPAERSGWIPAEVQRWGDFIEWQNKKDPRVEKWARRLLLCAAETGYTGWYEWNCANWGTKWGAYEFALRERSDGRALIAFDTAWSPPRPILEKLSSLWPSLVLDVEAVDEGGPEYMGRFCVDVNALDRVEHNCDRWRRAKGKCWEHDSEEDDQDDDLSPTPEAERLRDEEEGQK